MKTQFEIINNADELNIKEINNVVKRAKLLIINDNNEILLCKCNKNYFFIGGHVDNDESDMECLQREILEESGVELEFNDLEIFMSIKYFNRNYPEQGINTLSIINYYILEYNFIPDYNNTNLTEDEIKGNFKLEYINKKDVLNILEQSLEESMRPGVTLDTIKVIKNYLSIYNK